MTSMLLTIPAPPTSTLFPYTTLFRSCQVDGGRADSRASAASLPDAVAVIVLHRCVCDRHRWHLRSGVVFGRAAHQGIWSAQDRKSTRLNSSHITISYAVFCLKKKKNS